MRITRRPEQTRPKKRGDGFTTEQARVLLSEYVADGDWSVVSTRVGEADAEIADLMGMSAEQFFQVVLLPQGQFAQFLHANAEKRGELLQRLFGTDRFRAVEKWLAARRVEVSHEVADATARLGQLAARIGEAAGEGLAGLGSADLGPADLAPAELAAWAGQLAAGAEADAAVAAGEAEVVQERLDIAQAGRREAERLADVQRRRVTALRRHAELTEAEPRIGALRAELGAAQRAAEVASALAAAERRGSRARPGTRRRGKGARRGRRHGGVGGCSRLGGWVGLGGGVAGGGAGAAAAGRSAGGAAISRRTRRRRGRPPRRRGRQRNG